MKFIDRCLSLIAECATWLVASCIILLVVVGGWKLVEVFWRIWHYVLQSF